MYICYYATFFITYFFVRLVYLSSIQRSKYVICYKPPSKLFRYYLAINFTVYLSLFSNISYLFLSLVSSRFSIISTNNTSSKIRFLSLTAYLLSSFILVSLPLLPLLAVSLVMHSRSPTHGLRASSYILKLY